MSMMKGALLCSGVIGLGFLCVSPVHASETTPITNVTYQNNQLNIHLDEKTKQPLYPGDKLTLSLPHSSRYRFTISKRSGELMYHHQDIGQYYYNQEDHTLSLTFNANIQKEEVDTTFSMASFFETSLDQNQTIKTDWNVGCPTELTVPKANYHLQQPSITSMNHQLDYALYAFMNEGDLINETSLTSHISKAADAVIDMNQLCVTVALVNNQNQAKEGSIHRYTSNDISAIGRMEKNDDGFTVTLNNRKVDAVLGARDLDYRPFVAIQANVEGHYQNGKEAPLPFTMTSTYQNDVQTKKVITKNWLMSANTGHEEEVPPVVPPKDPVTPQDPPQKPTVPEKPAPSEDTGTVNDNGTSNNQTPSDKRGQASHQEDGNQNTTPPQKVDQDDHRPTTQQEDTTSEVTDEGHHNSEGTSRRHSSSAQRRTGVSHPTSSTKVTTASSSIPIIHHASEPYRHASEQGSEDTIDEEEVPHMMASSVGGPSFLPTTGDVSLGENSTAVLPTASNEVTLPIKVKSPQEWEEYKEKQSKVMTPKEKMAQWLDDLKHVKKTNQTSDDQKPLSKNYFPQLQTKQGKKAAVTGGLIISAALSGMGAICVAPHRPKIKKRL